MMNQTIRATFSYDALGYGNLCLFDSADLVIKLECRSGSKAVEGVEVVLRNALEKRVYHLLDAPVKVDHFEAGKMYIPQYPGFGWKQRLWLKCEKGPDSFTHLLVHPDGGKGGSTGCIVTQRCNGMEWYYYMENYFAKNSDGIYLVVS